MRTQLSPCPFCASTNLTKVQNKLFTSFKLTIAFVEIKCLNCNAKAPEDVWDIRAKNDQLFQARKNRIVDYKFSE